MSTTTAILDVLRGCGYAVTTRRAGGRVVMHAVPATPGDALPQTAVCPDGDGPEEEYRCACLLAAACGVDLEDG